MTTPPFWLPALDRPQLWRTLLGFVLIMGIWFAGTFAILFAGAALFDRRPEFMVMGTDPVSAGVFFFSFIGFPVGLALVLRLLHGRGFSTVFGPSRRLDLRHFTFGVMVTLSIATLLGALIALERQVFPADLVPELVRVQPVGRWLGMLPIALALILLQSLAEEVVFRGYLLQQLRARFRPALIWAVAPSFVFGLLHFNPASYGYVNASAYVFNATVMGTLAALVTVRTGNLGAAAGLHFGNNASLVGLGIAGQLDGFSLYSLEMGLAGPYTTYSILMQTTVMTLAFVAWWLWMARHRPIANDAGAA